MAHHPGRRADARYNRFTVTEPTAPTTVNATDAGARSTPRWMVVVLAGVVLLSALSAWTTWQTHLRTQTLEQELVRRQQDSQANVLEAKVAARQAQELSRDAAARASLLEARVAEVALQRSQVEELIRSVNLSRDESVVAEIEAALRVASQQTTLTGSAEPMILALKSAQERLDRVQLPGLENVRRAVGKDLDRLKGTRVADLAVLSSRLDDAIRLIDEAPLLNSPSDSRADTTVTTSRRAQTGTPPNSAPIDAASSGAQAVPSAGSWSEQAWQWSRQWAQVAWHETRGLIRLSRIEHPESMLVAPEESFFLRENLKLRLLNARLALLSRQTPTALNDLKQVQGTVPRYFDMRSGKAQRLVQLIQDTSSQAQQTAVPRPDDTLAALAAVGGLR